jgi:hypothetical protein
MEHRPRNRLGEKVTASCAFGGKTPALISTNQDQVSPVTITLALVRARAS